MKNITIDCRGFVPRSDLHKAFAVPHPEKVKDCKILLVDDVLTTGSTLHACAETLLQAGAAKIVIFTVARR